MSESGKLVLIATPIGNLSDLSPRAIEALGAASFWVVEDTRISGKLQSHLGFKKPMKILNDHTGDNAVAKYLEEIEEGAVVALITDGGAPVISDPGSRLCDACLDAEIEVEAIPGPSAVTTALMLSGFFAQRFAFLGFLGRKPGAIRGELEPFKDSPLTLVLFESPFRFEALLNVAFEVFGERRFTICREMTKLHEQVYRGKLPIIPDEKLVPRKGEVTIVIEGVRRARVEE
ncbi:MAG: 16S rRNA (cytidine(1402)-2'-O)-methyltransferase [Armatimonadetes bacterium 55-13]|nr:16S rRNA (cytidine(1402)-2'-O)-methyltransferase [Armatimonadota bacterium]OJU65703.1 MAG: 16S rRNA (cytidine(1402)-2'-O)-methyltransferase [Armatimonadetes bacterium 55-13]